MKIKSNRLEEVDYVITLIEKTNLYTVMISRLNPPFFAIIYDHLTKTGTHAENQQIPANTQLLLEKAIRFGLSKVEFDDIEMEGLISNSKIQKQYKEFLDTLIEDEKKNWKFKKFVNKKGLSL